MFRIKEARERVGLTQKELADSLGIKPSTFNGYEKGTHDPKSDILMAIADKCGVTVDFLLGVKEKAPAMQELSRELTLLIKWFSQASAHDQASILRFAELAAAASQRSVDLNPEERARAVLRELALKDSLSEDKGQVL